MRKLYRSRTDRMIAGVCGGLGHYLGIDPALVRIFFVLLVFFGEGTGLLIYFILAIVVPRAPEGEETGHSAGPFYENRQTALIIGAALMVLGGFLLLDNLNLNWLWWLEFDFLWPVAVMAAGAVLLWRAVRGEGQAEG